jgi:hypothetical protein
MVKKGSWKTMETLWTQCEKGKTEKWVRTVFIFRDGTPYLTFFPSKESLVRLCKAGDLRLFRLGTSFVVPI